MNIRVTWWCDFHTPQVLAIEQLNDTNTPFGKKEYDALLSQRTHVGMVAEHGMSVVGFCIYELRKGNNLILIIQAHPAYDRDEVITSIIENLKTKVQRHRDRRFLLVEIKESDVELLNIFKKNGFFAYKVVKNDYTDSDDDGVVMKWDKSPAKIEEKEEIVL